ncbi:MAG: flavin reductase family protein [Candidatus Cloacimonetes bacterium]|nr:flavin reductase family protein [Candidatus Cloacimonadota bacterium]
MEPRTQPTDFATAKDQTRHPARVAVAVVIAPDGKPNMITLEWFMRTSLDPPMLAISVGHTRYSHACLQQNRHFNLALLSAEQSELARVCGNVSGADTDKFAATGMAWFKGRLAGLPVIQGAAAVFECEVVTQVRSGDHTIFVGEVKHSWHTPGLQPLTMQKLQEQQEQRDD